MRYPVIRRDIVDVEEPFAVGVPATAVELLTSVRSSPRRPQSHFRATFRAFRHAWVTPQRQRLCISRRTHLPFGAADSVTSIPRGTPERHCGLLQRLKSLQFRSPQYSGVPRKDSPECFTRLKYTLGTVAWIEQLIRSLLGTSPTVTSSIAQEESAKASPSSVARDDREHPRRSTPYHAQGELAILFVDTETTGLTDRDEIVEFGATLITYDPDSARLGRELNYYNGLREPSCPISPGAFRIHGLDLKQLRGKRLNNELVAILVRRADFLVAHNAAFDRRFVNHQFPFCRSCEWLCSCRNIAWTERGFTNAKLHDLLAAHSIRPNRAHRALDDARALAELLRHSDYFRELLSWRDAHATV